MVATLTQNGVVPVNVDGIPAELKALPQWVLWKLVPDDSGKPRKLPFQINGQLAKSNDSTTWATFDAALVAYQRGSWLGIGCMFSKDDPFCGLDFDGCRDPETGAIDDWALDHLGQFVTYTEVSPSGTGFKLWLRGSLPETFSDGKPVETGAQTGKHNRPAGPGRGGKEPGIEAYDERRFFCVTGNAVDGAPAEISEVNGELHEWFHRTFTPKPSLVQSALATSSSTDDRRKLIERTVAYLKELPPAVSGERGHNRAYRAACVCRCEFGLSHDESWQALQEWNSTCSPPWSEPELRRKLDEAAKEPVTLRLANAERVQDPDSGIYKPASQIKPAPKAEPPLALKAITSAELDSGDFTVEFHVEEWIPVHQPGAIGAPSKALKTTTAVAAFMSISTGDSLFGRFPVSVPARCCLISAESGFAALQRTGRAIAASNGRSLSDYSDLLWCDQVLDLGNDKHIAELTQFVKDNGVKVLGLDPAYLLMPGLGDHANNLFEMGRHLRAITIIGQECGVTPVLIHHFKKTVGQGYEEPELEWLAHAGFCNWARWWILLNRRSKYDPENRGYHELWAHTGGSAGHSSAWALNVNEGLRDGSEWSVDVMYASEAREQQAEVEASQKTNKRDRESIAAQTANRQKIQDALRKFPKGGTASDISASAGVAFNKAKGILHDLALGETVRECAVVKANKQAYAGYQLSEFPIPQTQSDTPTVGGGIGVSRTDHEHTHSDTPL